MELVSLALEVLEELCLVLKGEIPLRVRGPQLPPPVKGLGRVVLFTPPGVEYSLSPSGRIIMRPSGRGIFKPPPG